MLIAEQIHMMQVMEQDIQRLEVAILELDEQLREKRQDTNELLRELCAYYPNLSSDHWKWTNKQTDILRLKHVQRLIDTKQTHKTKSKPRPGNYNILTQQSFDM